MASEFYLNLTKIESLLASHLTINMLGEGLLSVNEQLIDTNEQLEMLTPDFFWGTSEYNPTIKAYMQFFQKMGILPIERPDIPIIRDIPLRTQSTHPNIKEQQRVFAQCLEEHILTNQWSMLFPKEYQLFRDAIENGYKNEPIEKKMITLDAEGHPLKSGGYAVEKHLVHGTLLWLRTPASQSKTDIATAIDQTLADKDNTVQIVNDLKPKLLTKAQIAFNVRGVSLPLNSFTEIQNTHLGGGHQHFLMLDRPSKTIYSINNTKVVDQSSKEALEQNPLAFKEQIELFLKNLGDATDYKFVCLHGKSRQPDDETYLSQVCSISQFCHYAAILSGSRIDEIEDFIPAKVSTLMYLLQFAFTHHNNALFGMLNRLLENINQQLEAQDKSVPKKVKKGVTFSPHVQVFNDEDEGCDYFNELKVKLQMVEGKALDLEARRFYTERDVARALIIRMNKEIQVFSDLMAKDGAADVDLFKRNCLAHINEARPVLAKHRGWLQLMGNIALFIAGLGIGFLIAGLIHKTQTNKFLFFDTDSEQKLDELARETLCIQ